MAHRQTSTCRGTPTLEVTLDGCHGGGVGPGDLVDVAGDAQGKSVLFKQPDFVQQVWLPAISKHSQRGLITHPVFSRAS
jgi:hypothetical protein